MLLFFLRYFHFAMTPRRHAPRHIFFVFPLADAFFRDSRRRHLRYDAAHADKTPAFLPRAAVRDFITI